VKLFFRQFGNGYPLVILHGLFGISDNWVTFGKRMGADFSVFIPDLRNHGQSPHSPVFDYSSMVEDLAEFLDDRGLDEIFLLGHSLGGKIAMQFAIGHPDRIMKLVIVDISPRKYPPNLEHQQLLDAMLSVDLDGIDSRSEAEKQLALRIGSQKLRQFLLKNLYWNSRSRLEWRLNLASINANLPQMFEGIEEGKDFRKPALFIRGGQSGYISDTDLPLIRSMFPDSELETIMIAGHWVHADAPEEFYSLVSAFLKQG
jgi:esterase